MGGALMYEIPAADEARTAPSSKTHASPLILNGAVLAALLSAAGTGGVANAQALPIHTLTAPVPYACSVNIRNDEAQNLLGVQEKMAGIRHYLSLNVTDLAGILKVGRPTVYSWATFPVTIKSKHRERLDAVYVLARDWRTLSNIPMGRLVREPIVNGITIIDLLSRDNIDNAMVRDAMQRIKELQDRTEKRLTVAEVGRKAGIQVASRPRTNWRSSIDLDI